MIPIPLMNKFKAGGYGMERLADISLEFKNFDVICI
jgi:hypothetical protein